MFVLNGKLKGLEVLKNSKKIIVLKGGPSEEREISIKTGNQVEKALSKQHYVKGVLVSQNLSLLTEKILKFEPNVIFNALHGNFGEDGQIQSILNALNIPYTHSGVVASSIGMNKYFSKIIFENVGIRCPKGEKFKLEEIQKTKIKIPSIIKPTSGGSSIGIIKIFKNEQISKKNLLKSNSKNEEYLVEDFIEGREITVGILDNKICGITEIITNSKFYDFKSKYVQVAKHIQNPKLPEKIIKELENNSLLAHNILGCNYISRSDFRYDEKNQKLYLLEINTQPGLTADSLIPEMAKKNGISFVNLCNMLIDSARCEKL